MEYCKKISHKITKLNLICFRNHINFEMGSDSHFIVIKGLNGSGKTNILEALSLFSPGKGLRSIKFEEALSNTSTYSSEWGAHIYYSCNDVSKKISTGYNIKDNKSRRIILDGEQLKKQANVLEYLRLIWLTPQMDGIFLTSASHRRKFFDRICYNLYPEHAKRISLYEHNLKSRMNLLQQPKWDDLWLDSLETQLAKLTIQIDDTRHKVINSLQEVMGELSELFLRPVLKIKNKEEFANLQEEGVKSKFTFSRKLDSVSGRSNFGPHKVDLIATHPQKKILAPYCSTGEQKSMLLALILAQAKSIREVSNISPIILLDEVLAHFDEPKQVKILNALDSLKSQIWITTVKSSIENLISSDSLVVAL